ncbi:MAG TPA: glycosyltransferase family 2 protein [Candidatus Acidoferrales bacterium]|nr:glycosyltransferase family 2 protein [Candidatus Acidoferrales bacterium]
MPRLTATLISYNEEVDLPRAFASLTGIADEIILVDSGSTDRTTEVAQSFGARVYTRKLDSFATQKNYAASLSSNDWIFSMDCDEELSPELRASLLAWKEQTPEKNGYEILLLTNYLGGWIRHSGWYPERKLLLYRRDKGQFESALHERVHLEGSPGRTQGHLFHYTIRSLTEHRAKLDAMTTLAAEDMFARGYKIWRPAMIFAAPWTILQRLVFQGGILDGRRGWLIAWFSAKYIYVKYRKLGQLLGGKQLSHRSWPSPGGV